MGLGHLLTINKGRRSRFSDDNYAYLKTRLGTIGGQEAAEHHEEESAHKEEELRLGRQANELAGQANEIAHKAYRWSKVALAVAVIVPVIGWLLSSIWPHPLRFPTTRITSDWRPLVQGPTGLSIEVVAKSDLPEPEIRQITGQAKFVDNQDNQDQGTNHTVRLGYKITVDVAPLDLAKVPEKYLKEKPIDIGGGKTITQLPIKQSTHKIRFDFTLKDSDGFKLMELRGDPENLESGRANKFQRLLSEPVPEILARRTTAIVSSLSIEKCVTCGGE